MEAVADTPWAAQLLSVHHDRLRSGTWQALARYLPCRSRQPGCFPCRLPCFEDIIPGIQAGKRAGMEVCAVEDAYSLAEREEKEKLADYYIVDFNHLWEGDTL